MRVSERKTNTPVGLSRFLVKHREHEGFETMRDSSLVTVICSGCEASFSYLKPAEAEETPADIDEALARITGGGNGAATAPPLAKRPSDVPRNGATPERRATPQPPEAPSPPRLERRRPQPNGAGRRRAATEPVSPLTRLHEPYPVKGMGSRPRPVTARRLAPPGPHAPRRRRNDPLAQRLGWRIREFFAGIAAWAAPRRRTVALTALAIAGAYVFISLSLGDDASSSPSGTAAVEPVTEEVAATAQSTTPPAAPDEGPMAEGARPLQSFEAGGPDVQDQTVPPGNFAVAMPPDWTRVTTEDGSTVFVPDDGGGAVIVATKPRETATYGQMTDEAAGYIAARVDPGTAVARPAWIWVGNLLRVANASEPDGHNEIAYIGVAGDTRYLVVRSIEPSASGLVRLQADGIVTSLTAQ